MLLQNQAVEAMPQNNANWLVVDPGLILPGLRVAVTLPDGRRLVREVLVGSSYLASEDPRLHFGIGAAEFVSTVEVTWPDSEVDEILAVEANQILSLRRE